MNITPKTLVLSVSALTLLGFTAYFGRKADSQPPRPRQGQPAELTAKPEVKIEVKDDYRYITSNGIPDHPTGQFPNRGNPNSISPQEYKFRVPANPQPAEREARGQVFGVAVNGIPFDPGTAELWNGNFRWHYEALSGFMATRGSLGIDDNFAHVQPNGAYHYHGLPLGLLKKKDYQNKMALVGYAADGFPIYGPYGYSDPNDLKSPLKPLKSSYRLKEGMRPGGADSPGGAYDGSFESDFEYVKGLGDLDAYCGRTGVTPEYPKGTFYYVLTDKFPFVPRKFRGTPDPSFQKGPGGPNRGNQGGFPPNGAPPGGPGGFGGPPGGPGGFGGPGRPMGLPPGFVPGEILEQYLGLTKDQKVRLDRLVKTMEALQKENFAMPAFARLNLKEDQIRQIAEGKKVSDVLTSEQKKVLETNKRPAFGGPGGPGGPPGGPGGVGGPGGPPPGE